MLLGAFMIGVDRVKKEHKVRFKLFFENSDEALKVTMIA